MEYKEPMGIDDLISVMETHNMTGRPVKNLCGRSEHEVLGEILDYLKAYRKGGLFPDEAQAIAMVRAEGRLVEIPCRIGDVVYKVYNTRGCKNCTKSNSACDGMSCPDPAIYELKFSYDMLNNLQDIYFTSEEAKKVLEGGGENV